MRSMARPLAQSPMGRPAAGGRPGQPQRTLRVASSNGRSSAPAVRRVHGEPGISRVHQNPQAQHHQSHARQSEPQHRQALVHRNSSIRQDVRRRRANVVFILLISTCTTLFLHATTQSTAMTYAFVLSFLSLCGYCYKLVQIKQLENQANSYADNSWFRAA